MVLTESTDGSPFESKDFFYDEPSDQGDPELHHYPEPDEDDFIAPGGFDAFHMSERVHVYDEHVYNDGAASSVMVEICDDSVPEPIATPPPRTNTTTHHRRASSGPVDLDDLEAPPPRRQQQQRRSKPRKSKSSRKKRKTPAVKPKKYNPSLPEPKRDYEPSKCWPAFARACSFFVPDCLIGKDKNDDAKLAWREKFTIFEIMVFANLLFLVIFGLIPLYFCRDDTPLSEYEDFVEPACKAMNILMYVVLYFVAGLLVLQCACSMIVGCRSVHARMNKPVPEEMDSGVMVMVPCYNEGDAELRKTIKSILKTDYPDDNKVLLVVADGIITGRGEWTNTPRTLANLLGFEVNKRDKAYNYDSIGAVKANKASLYHGTYEDKGRSLKYIVIVKRGGAAEKNSPKPGNRGKRDSQLIALGMFNRVHHDRKLSELDEQIIHALNDLELPPTELQYLLAIDADTRISDSSISYMVDSMEKNQKTLACCGETKVDNKGQSWVTMIQVYEYFASHHLKKAFESVFGCVTCLPGCFTMYRMFDDDWRPLLPADNILQAYARNDIDSLHEKNLFLLGEDRMLTTLLLQYFPDMNLSFVPVAACWTIVPNSFKVLLSQRRRWINSTFHNMWELLKVQTMCGICCISMNTIVFIDMVSTLILPACVLYAVNFIYVVIKEGGESFTTYTIITYGILIGCQLLIAIVRGRLDYLWWFAIYFILGIPIFFVVLPIYSFWHMDDLSWGTTRQVEDKKAPSGGGQPKKVKAAHKREEAPGHRRHHSQGGGQPPPRAKPTHTRNHSLVDV